MQVYDSVEQALEDNDKCYVSHAQIAPCMVCGEKKDLRCGACHQCLSKVDGEPIQNKSGKTIGHKLFEKGNPDNSWVTGV